METQKTHWKKLINPNYIGSYSLDGHDLNVEIVKVIKEQVLCEGGKKEECTVAYLKNQKPFILNRTNQKVISKLLNSPYIEDWTGKKITLFPTTTKLAGEVVECLRVRPMLPKEVDNTKAINDDCELLLKCTDLDELKDVYSSLKFATDLKVIKVKDDMKLKLSKTETK